MQVSLLSLLIILLCYGTDVSSAWNWNGTLKTKIQTDNRYTRYVDDTRVFGEIWGSFEAFDNNSWLISTDFVSRESLEDGFEGDIYQLYAEKKLANWNSKVKAGRFQRADSLGYYSLDGASWQYKMPEKGLNFEVYGGKPLRQEDVRSVSGDWLYGFELYSLQQLNWKNKVLPIDSWGLRFGFQQFHDEQTSTRLSLGNTIDGHFNQDWLHAYEFSFMSTLETETGVFEELLTSLSIDITEARRVRISYALYEPKLVYPTFKERFYSAYYQGRQDLLSMSFNHDVGSTYSYHAGWKRAARNTEHDIGYGFDMGMQSQYFADWRLSADFDMLEFGKSSSYNLYFSGEYSLNINSLLTLNLAYSLDDSILYAKNKAAGTEIKYRYKVQRHVFLDIASSYIVNSRLNDEYLVGVQLTWYFDNFQPKVKM